MTKIIIVLLLLQIINICFCVTECQRKRIQALDNKNNQTNVQANVLIPECDENGDYLPLQCYGTAISGGRFCLCWDKESQVVRGPSKNIKACKCFVEQYEAAKRNIRYFPQCEDSGFYKSLQCSIGKWWCVDPNKGIIKGLKHSGSCSQAKC
jgi:hypothetical protein